MSETPAAPIARTVLGDVLPVSRLGLGCMVMTRSYATPDPAESIATLESALDQGLNFLDTSSSYAEGEIFTLADIALGTYARRWFGVDGVEKPDFPHLRRWYDALEQRPGFQTYVAQPLT